jgi:hypothetical protein
MADNPVTARKIPRYPGPHPIDLQVTPKSLIWETGRRLRSLSLERIRRIVSSLLKSW